MMLHVPNVLSKAQVTEIRAHLAQTDWVEGSTTAGQQAQQLKHNLQLSTHTETYPLLSSLILKALQQHHLITSAGLPKHILPPLFNCYQGEGYYGNHVDSAIHRHPLTEQAIRTDVSLTVFLSEPEEYDGGELIIEDTYGSHEVKLDAGDAILYPATSLHRVEPVTRGQRLAAFTWIQSMVKDDWQRSMLFNLDMTILKLRHQLGDNSEIVHLTSHYHNLLRQWGDL